MSNIIFTAFIGGFLGTTVMTSMMLLGRKLNLPAVDAHGILGFVQSSERASPLGYVMHWLMGVTFALGYIILFRAVHGDVIILSIPLELRTG